MLSSPLKEILALDKWRMHAAWSSAGPRTRRCVLDAKDQLLKMCFSEGNPTPESGLSSYFTALQNDVAPLVLWQPSQEQTT